LPNNCCAVEKLKGLYKSDSYFVFDESEFILGGIPTKNVTGDTSSEDVPALRE
jgi:hypothetical protein